MTEIFNLREIKPPPTCCLKTKVTNHIKDAVRDIKETLHNCISVLSDQSSWTTELFVLSRLIYKMNCQFRINKSLQGLKRVQACVKRYNEMNILKDVTEVSNLMDSQEDDSLEVYLPSRQMFEYIVVQLMGAAALLTQTSNYCAYTYHYLELNLKLGNFIPQNTLFISVVSRIWALSKSTCLCFVSWYDQLYRHLKQLEATQISWLPENYMLPPNLSDWLKTVDTDLEEIQIEELPDSSSEVREPSSTDLSEHPSTSNDNKTHDQESIDKGEHTMPWNDNEDIGQPVARMTEFKGSKSGMLDIDTDYMSDDQADDTMSVEYLDFQLNLRKVNSAKSLNPLKQVVRSLLKMDFSAEKKLQIRKCLESLKRLKKKQNTKGRVTEKFLSKGKKFVRLLLKSLQATGTVDDDSFKKDDVEYDDNNEITEAELAKINDRNGDFSGEKGNKDTQEVMDRTAELSGQSGIKTSNNVEYQNITMENLVSCKFGAIKRLANELKKQKSLTLGGKRYIPETFNVGLRLQMKLTRMAKISGDEKMNVWNEIKVLLKRCKQAEGLPDAHKVKESDIEEGSNTPVNVSPRNKKPNKKNKKNKRNSKKRRKRVKNKKQQIVT